LTLSKLFLFLLHIDAVNWHDS